MFDPFIRQSLLVLFLISGIPLVMSSVVGLIISAIQSATQIQEQSISYTAKFFVIAGTTVVLSTWYSTSLIEYFQTLLGSLPMLGRVR